jgi:hypothetical protein
MAVPKGSVRDYKNWWSDDAEMAVSAAKAVKRAWVAKPGNLLFKEEAKRTRKAASKTSVDAKQQCYHKFLCNLDLQSDPGAPFLRLLKNMDKPSGSPSNAALQGTN